MNVFMGGNASPLLATAPAVLGELTGAIRFVETSLTKGCGTVQQLSRGCGNRNEAVCTGFNRDVRAHSGNAVVVFVGVRDWRPLRLSRQRPKVYDEGSSR
jgi:hypothetical protein